MPTDIQAVNSLLEELGMDGDILTWNRKYPCEDVILESVIQDLRYITSEDGLRRFGPEENVVDTAERYLELTRVISGMAQDLFVKTDITKLTDEEFEKVDAFIKGFERGNRNAFAQLALEKYQEKTGEYPDIEVFRKNANIAIWHVEESPKYQPLVPLLKEYINFLDSLPQG